MLAGVLVLMTAALPPHAKREAPPPRIEEHALAVGATAPAFALPDADGTPRSVHGTAVVVFYRGHW